ncbi:MAG: hypothetical protein L0216_09240 [Planctomycetales bacterium]|nr:hypothetical protein [Planctomycetales bacterium]
MHRRVLSAALLAVAGSGSGCGAFGNYLANRSRDFGECFRVQAGLGFGLGAGVRVGGVVEAGLGLGAMPYPLGLGWNYGYGYALGAATHEIEGKSDSALPVDAEFLFPVPLLMPGEGPNAVYAEIGIRGPGRLVGRYSYGALPALISYGRKKTWIWSDDDTGTNRWLRVHAFDVEASAYAGFVCARVGFSPGEFLDFVLGWFGIDIAGDDRAYEPPAKRVR